MHDCLMNKIKLTSVFFVSSRMIHFLFQTHKIIISATTTTTKRDVFLGEEQDFIILICSSDAPSGMQNTMR